jgi:hypothetical protein
MTENYAIDLFGRFRWFILPPGTSMAQHLRQHPKLRRGCWMSVREAEELWRQELQQAPAQRLSQVAPPVRRKRAAWLQGLGAGRPRARRRPLR